MKKRQTAKIENDYPSFDPYFSEKAKMEINVNEFGVSFVGNLEGYLSFARFFNYLAEVHMSIREEAPKPETNTVYGYGAYHFSDYVNNKALQQGKFVFTPGPLENLKSHGSEQGVLFWLSDVIGTDFWSGPSKDDIESK